MHRELEALHGSWLMPGCWTQPCVDLPAETGQANLFSIVKVSLVICQVLEKYFTWVKSIYNRTQKRFLRNHPPIWKKSFICVCICQVSEV